MYMYLQKMFNFNIFSSLRYRGGVSQQEKRIHKNSFVTIDINNQLKDLLQRKSVHITT